MVNIEEEKDGNEQIEQPLKGEIRSKLLSTTTDGHVEKGTGEDVFVDARSESEYSCGCENEQEEEEVIQVHVSKEKAELLKQQANDFFKANEINNASECYSEAIYYCPNNEKELKAILYSNRAACYQRLLDHDQAIADTSAAIVENPCYAKAYMRRFRSYEATKKWHDALTDLKKAMELDPKIKGEHERSTYPRIERESKIQMEKDKEEMIGKMKDLGNFFLGKFGLSTDNFKLEQNENGSYNIQYQQ